LKVTGPYPPLKTMDLSVPLALRGKKIAGSIQLTTLWK
jgi:hypothetical protein